MIKRIKIPHWSKFAHYAAILASLPFLALSFYALAREIETAIAIFSFFLFFIGLAYVTKPIKIPFEMPPEEAMPLIEKEIDKKQEILCYIRCFVAAIVLTILDVYGII